jgi:hypothetical protein
MSQSQIETAPPRREVIPTAAERCEHAGRQLLEAVAYATGEWWLLYANHDVAVSVSYHYTHLLEDERTNYYTRFLENVQCS